MGYYFLQYLNLYSSPIISSPYLRIKLILYKMLKLLQFGMTLESASQHYKSSLFVFSPETEETLMSFSHGKISTECNIKIPFI